MMITGVGDGEQRKREKENRSHYTVEEREMERGEERGQHYVEMVTRRLCTTMDRTGTDVRREEREREQNDYVRRLTRDAPVQYILFWGEQARTMSGGDLYA